MDLMEVAGWETTVCLKDLYVLSPVTHQLQSHVLMEKMFVTMDLIGTFTWLWRPSRNQLWRIIITNTVFGKRKVLKI